VSRAAHLVARFFGSLRPRTVDAETLAWVERMLEPGELHVWEGLGRADRAESIAVARRLDRALADTGDTADSTWTAAALLHDVGKQASAYGPIGRSFVTTIGAFAGRDNVRAWSEETSRVRGRMGRYVAHDDVGADLLTVAGARPAASAWAAAHHRPELWDSSGIPTRICRALARADGEPVPPE
jgi:hypothetical protein